LKRVEEGNMLFIIEHLEPRVSEWLCIEYSNAAQIVGRERLLITNVKKSDEFEKLSRIACTERKHFDKLFWKEEVLVLDPRARKKLSPGDFIGKKAIIIGGILGADPPLGRTEKLLTKRVEAPARNLGREQFSIDGAVYVAKKVSEGTPLKEVPVQLGIEIQIGRGHSVLLPYAYPIGDRGPLISRQLIRYLKRPWKLTP
jgi:ribosome biogenesis SPOUT family RNA methylase Rps3